MSLNGSALNSNVLNGTAGYVASVGTFSIDIIQDVYTASAYNIDLVQNTGSVTAAQTITDLRQLVNLLSIGSYNIDVIQNNVSTGTKNIDVEQRVENAAAPNTFYERNDYLPLFYLNNSQLSESVVHAESRLTFTEGQAPQLNFTIIPGTGYQNLYSYRGKSVVCKVKEPSGTTTLFTGKVNEPTIEHINQYINLSCSIDIEQQVEDTVTRAELDKIGLYSNTVFSEPRTKLQELKDRLSTVAQDFNINPEGNIEVVSISAKSSADYTITNSGSYYSLLGHTLGSKQSYINKVKIKVDNSWLRLHHIERTFQVNMGVTNFCDWVNNGYTKMRRDLVYSAIQGIGWPLKTLTYTPWFADGFYNCNGATIGNISNICQKSINENTGVTNDGNQQYEAVETSCRNASGLVCLGASWIASTQFAQSITDSYEITVQAPQSIAQNGSKVKEETFTLASEYDASDWEGNPNYNTSAPDGYQISGVSGGNFYCDIKDKQKDFNTAVNILLQRARCDILKSHRDDKVVFRTQLMSEIQLKHTVYLNTDRIVAKGKVYSYTHYMNNSTGEAYTDITLAVSQSSGSASTSNLAVPSAAAITPVYETSNISFSATYGVDASEQSNPTGYFGNKWVTYRNGVNIDYIMTQYPVQLILKAPAIPDNIRADTESPNSQSYDISIPNDVMFDYFPDE